jgi:putative transposase
MGSLQKFDTPQASLRIHFNHERALYSRDSFKLNRTAALVELRGLRSA